LYILTNDGIKFDLAKFLFTYVVILFKDKNGLYATHAVIINLCHWVNVLRKIP
jgi:hypothetical protein